MANQDYGQKTPSIKPASSGYTPNIKDTSNKAMPDKQGKDPKAMLADSIKKTWNKLSDDDIKLYDNQPDQFFDKLKTKHGITREDANKTLRELKTSCGCGSEKAA